MRQLGWEGKLYINTGTFATPTWTEVTAVNAVTLSPEKQTSEVIERGDDWSRVLAKIKNATIEVTLNHDPGNTEHATLRDAYYQDNLVDVAVADGDILASGTEYFRAECDVTAFGREEPATDPMTTPVTLQPSAKSANKDSQPVYVVVA